MVEDYLSLGNKARTLERKKIASVRVDSKEYISVVKYKCVSVPNADEGVSSGIISITGNIAKFIGCCGKLKENANEFLDNVDKDLSFVLLFFVLYFCI